MHVDFPLPSFSLRSLHFLILEYSYIISFFFPSLQSFLCTLCSSKIYDLFSLTVVIYMYMFLNIQETAQSVYLCITCVQMTLALITWHQIANLGMLPREDQFSHSQHCSVACLSLSGVESQPYISLPCQDVSVSSLFRMSYRMFSCPIGSYVGETSLVQLL